MDGDNISSSPIWFCASYNILESINNVAKIKEVNKIKDETKEIANITYIMRNVIYFLLCKKKGFVKQRRAKQEIASLFKIETQHRGSCFNYSVLLRLRSKCFFKFAINFLQTFLVYLWGVISLEYVPVC